MSTFWRHRFMVAAIAAVSASTALHAGAQGGNANATQTYLNRTADAILAAKSARFLSSARAGRRSSMRKTG